MSNSNDEVLPHKNDRNDSGEDRNDNGEDRNDRQEEEPMVLGLGGDAESDMGTIFVNSEYRIKRFVSTVTELINIHSFNKDHSIEEFTSRLLYDEFKEDINRVLKNKRNIKREVADKSGRYYLMELEPYLTKHKVEGVVVTFVDVTELKEAENELAEKVEKIKALQRQIINNDVSERWEIGRYLHDELAQSLLSAKFMLSHLKEDIAKEDGSPKKEMEQLMEILNRSIEGARDLSHEVVPIDLEEEGVQQAFDSLVKQVEKIHGIRCRLDFDEAVDILDNIERATHLYRIAHEAAKNAVVHGEAENIRIGLQSGDGYLYLDIEDDGTGISETDKVEGGMGINIMRHRMELIGGTLRVESPASEDHKGTLISCKVPLE